MVLNEGDKCVRGRTECGAAPRSFLPKVGLTLKQVAVLGRGNKFLRSAKIIGVVGFPSPGQRDGGAMMKIVVPHRVEIVTTFGSRPYELDDLSLVFCDQNNRSRRGCFAGGPAHRADDVFVRVVMNRIGGIETK